MPQEITEQETVDNNSAGKSKISPDVYENARKFNTQIATRGPAVLYALSKASEPLTKGNTVTGIGSMVMGAFGFFGNRYYKNKGDDSAYTYMGQIVGGVQFTAGFMLLAIEAFETYTDSGEASPLLKVLGMAGMALALTESALVLINSYLYGDGAPRVSSEVKPKMN
ncbi:hypothetical protein ACNVED_15100 (plasmid) [Legionella sp. D16C41]|uniref:hypothetical protein n=1 Tax=Legionella sp. D16C41 TaxID=3402688 RepID=UPI003AF9F7B3